jgi:hypothetical protein
MPRVTEPRASSSTLPCSAVTSPASSSMCWSIRLLRLNMTRARRTDGVADQPTSACLAASTAVATSLAVDIGTWLASAPSAGLKTLPKRALALSTSLPLT